MSNILARQRQIVGTAADWGANDLVLGAGELAVIRENDGTVRARVGDGSVPFSAAPYLTTSVATLRYMGNADPTAPPPAGADPGNIYSASPGGTVDASWGPPAAGTVVDEGDFLIQADDGSWHVQQGGVDLSGFVQSADLGATTGSSLVGFIQDDPLAIGRTIQDKGREIWSVLDFGADPTGATDSTDAFNRATDAAAVYTGNDTPLKRMVYVPRGHYKLGTADASHPNGKTVWVRRGQHLHGEGLGCYLDLTGCIGNTEPVIRLACGELYKDTPGADPGGLGVEISGFWTHGGSGVAPNISTDQCAGWWIHHMFMTSAGIGIYASGGDGIVSNCQFDQGLNGIVLFGANIIIAECNFYVMNYSINITKAHDVQITACHIEYPVYAGIQLGSGGGATDDIKGLAINSTKFIMNQQYSTHLGFIYIIGHGFQFDVKGCTFRNGFGYAITWGMGVGTNMTVTDCTFDQRKSIPGYVQGTTMGGISFTYGRLRMSGNTFWGLNNYPVEFAAGDTTTIVSQSDAFFDTGTPTEFHISGGVTTSELHILDFYTNQIWPKVLVNGQSTVKVFAPRALRGRMTLIGGGYGVSVAMIRPSSNVKIAAQIQAGTPGVRYQVDHSPGGGGFNIYSRDAAGAQATADVSTLYYEMDLGGN